MPYYRISVTYGSAQELYVKADSLKDAEDYAQDVETEVYIGVEEQDDVLEDDTIHDNIATEEE